MDSASSKGNIIMKRTKLSRFRLLTLLFLVCVLVTSCSANSDNPFIREKQKDVIKFYNLDWLSDVETVKQVFINDFGEGSFYMNYPKKYSVYSEKAGIFAFIIRNNDTEQPLGWDIGGGKVNYIATSFVNEPSVIAKEADYNQLCLCNAIYEFEPDYDAARKIKNRLDELYGKGEKGEHDSVEINYVWKDTNENTVELYYRGISNFEWGESPAKLTLNYKCGDIYKYLEKEKTEYKNEKQKEDANNDKL